MSPVDLIYVIRQSLNVIMERDYVIPEIDFMAFQIVYNAIFRMTEL